jgi:hypothetical protein
MIIKRCAFIAVALISSMTVAALAMAQNSSSLFEIAQIEGAGWSVDGLGVALDLEHADGPALTINARAIGLLGKPNLLGDLVVRCRAIALNKLAVTCENGHYSFSYAGEIKTGRLSLTYHARTRALTFTMPQHGPAGGQLTVTITDLDGYAGLTVQGQSLAVARLAPYLRDVLAHFDPTERDLELADGELDFEVQVDNSADPQMRARLELANFAFSNSSGRLASEALALKFSVQARADEASGDWRGALSFALDRGGLYAEPFYLDLEGYPLKLSADFIYDPAQATLSLPRFDAAQSGVLAAAGHLHGSVTHRFEEFVVDIEKIAFPAAYETWLAGLMVGTPLASLDTTGSAQGHFEMRADVPHALRIELDDINIEDIDGRFALYGLAGEIHWSHNNAELSSSQLNAAGGFVYGAGFDAIGLELGIAGAAIDLLAPARVPLLGGALNIKTFSLRDYGSDDLVLGFEAELEPIDLGQLTVALNWPAFSGTLSGRLPLLRYSKGVVTVGGNLEARAFDGDISIERLRIEQPLGIVPAISAAIRLRNLDLAQVTEVVPFGAVSGRLDGDIDDLRLLKGEPVSFDARFRTPADDDSRHRLSQRAVDTISRVAGGGAVLSTTFLSVFKHFAYDKLGLSCRLENDICHMDGVEQSDEGYYIVKGALLPRVDLIGRVRQVQWSRLMSQLERALNEGEFKIE